MRRFLLPFLEPGRSIPLFLLGTAVIALIIQFIQDWSNHPGVWQGSYTLTLFVILLTLLAGGVWAWQNRPQPLFILDEQKPRSRRGLIVLVSKHKGAAPAAIQHHLPTLTDCWLIATSGSAHVAVELAQQFSSDTTSFHYGTPFQVNDGDAASTYRVAKQIFTQEAPNKGLDSTEIIADITGGSKPMTTGLVLASVNERRAIQYVLAKKDNKGLPMTDTWGEPIKINTEYLSLHGIRSLPQERNG